MVRAIQPEPWPKWLKRLFAFLTLVLVGSIGVVIAMAYGKLSGERFLPVMLIFTGGFALWNLFQYAQRYEEVPVVLPEGWAEALKPLGITTVSFKGSFVHVSNATAVLPRASKRWSPELVAEVVAAHKVEPSPYFFGVGVLLAAVLQLLFTWIRDPFLRFLPMAMGMGVALYIAERHRMKKIVLTPVIQEALASLPTEAPGR